MKPASLFCVCQVELELRSVWRSALKKALKRRAAKLCCCSDATLYQAEGLILNETPDSEGEEACRDLGKGLATM